MTVPHGCLLFTKVCDEKADQITKETAKILGIDDVFINRFPRRIKDMNRKKSRRTRFRKKVTEAVRTGDDIIHLDVHSYPKEHSDWGDFDAIIFDIPLPEDDDLSSFLVDEFNKVGLKSKKIEGSMVNDLVRTTQELGKPAVLIEFKDTLDVQDTARKFAKVIKVLNG